MTTAATSHLRQTVLAASMLTGVVFFLMACGVDTGMGTNVAIRPQHVAHEGSSTAGMPRELRAAFVAARQNEASEAYGGVRDDAGTLRMPNPAQGLETKFELGGIVVHALEKSVGLSIRTTAFGCSGAEAALQEGGLEVKGNRASYFRDKIEEWYLNGPAGMEQGYTIAEAPACAGLKSIRMQVQGDLTAKLDDADGDGRGEALRFVDASGQTIFRYADLFVRDAAEKTLSAWMTVESNEIALHWDDTGATYPVVVDPVIVTEEAKLLSGDNGAAGDQLGTAVALNEAGTMAVVGAPYDDTQASNAGAAYIFARNGTSWQQMTKLRPPDRVKDRWFGQSVAFSSDTVLIGAPHDGAAPGAAYLYARTVSPVAETWTFQGELLAGDGAAGDRFGDAVALVGDTAIVGAPGAALGANSGQGAAYVFMKPANGWPATMFQSAKLVSDDGASSDQFGATVATSGTSVIVGAPLANVGANTNQGAAYVFVKPSGGWSVLMTQSTKLTASDGTASDQFGYSVAISGATALVGAPYGNFGTSLYHGVAYVYVRPALGWPTTMTQSARLGTSDGVSDDEFGYSVGLSGNTAIVGAIRHNGGKGAAYVYAKPTPGWPTTMTQSAKLQATNGTVNAHFGYSVAIVGNTVLAGEPTGDPNGASSGSSHVFTGSGTTWALEAQIISNDGSAEDHFGEAVALSGDTAVIAAPLDGDNGVKAGAAYVFVRNGATWRQQAKLVANDGTTNDYFAHSVALSGDTAAIGAYFDDANGATAGAAYIFVRNNETWTQQAKLVGNDGVTAVRFGQSIACWGDTVLVGAPYDANTLDAEGSAYVFVRSGTTWVLQTKLWSATPAFNGQFGSSVALLGDTALIGAPYELGKDPKSGTAHVFTRNGTAWMEQAQLVANDGMWGNEFGGSVALATDTAVIGAYQAEGNVAFAGAAYVFVRNGTSWMPQAKIQANDGAPLDAFGTSVCVVGDTLLVGASGDDDAGDASGSAYVFVRENGIWTQQFKFRTFGAAAGDALGTNVALSSDRSFALIGAMGDDDEGIDAGTVYAFTVRHGVGTSCTVNAACDSNFCVDGVCCNGPCNEACQYCSATKKGSGFNGYCGNAIDMTVDSRCMANANDPCGVTDTCRAGTCQVAPFGNDCPNGEVKCIGNQRYPKQICNGLGACIPDPDSLEPCGAYRCDDETKECKTECVTIEGDAGPGDCAPGFECKSGICVSTPECSSSKDCKNGRVCEFATLRCVPPQSTGDTPANACDCQMSSTSVPNRSSAAVLFALALLHRCRRRPTIQRRATFRPMVTVQRL